MCLNRIVRTAARLMVSRYWNFKKDVVTRDYICAFRSLASLLIYIETLIHVSVFHY